MDATTQSRVIALSHPPLILDRAEAALVARCLGRSRFRYLPHELAGACPEVVEGRLGGLGAPVTLELARRNGYGPLIRRLSAGADEDPERAQAEYLDTLPAPELDTYLEALVPSESPLVTVSSGNGIAVSAAEFGCVAEARTWIYGSVRSFLEIHNFRNRLTGRGDEMEADTRVQEATLRYRGSMGDMSLDVRDPHDARRQADQRFGLSRTLSQPVGDSERVMAIADASCQESSGINRVMERAFLDAISAWAIDHQVEIGSLQGQMDAAVVRADRALERSA